MEMNFHLCPDVITEAVRGAFLWSVRRREDIMELGSDHLEQI